MVIASEKKSMLCALVGTSMPNLRALAGSLSLTLSCWGARAGGCEAGAASSQLTCQGDLSFLENKASASEESPMVEMVSL